jgi:hypothetical protein
MTWRVYDLKCNRATIMCYYTHTKTEAGPHGATDFPSLSRDTRVKVTLVARPLLTCHLCRTVQMQTWLCSGVERVFVLEHYTSQRNPLFVKHSAMRLLTRMYRIRQQCTNWWENLETQVMSVCDKCPYSDNAIKIAATPFSNTASIATRYGCKNS